MVELARKSTQPTARERSLLKEKRKRLPVTLDMLEWLRNYLWKPLETIPVRQTCDDRMTFVGVVLAFAFLWRVSQYVCDSSCASHAIQSEDVLIIPYVGSPVQVYSASTLNPAQVKSILFVVRSSKSDRSGRGQYVYLQRNTPREETLLTTIVEWLQTAGHIQGDPLMCRRVPGNTIRKLLTRKMVSSALKAMATAHGYEEVAFAFTPHSLRIGGATSMINHGKTKDQVRRIAGWAPGTGNEEIYELDTPLDDNAMSVPSNCFQLLEASQLANIIPPSWATHFEGVSSSR